MEKCPFCGESLPDKTNSNNNAKCINKNPMKKCPFCAEEIKAEAIVCKHCGRDLTDKATMKTPFERKLPGFLLILLLTFILIALNHLIKC